MYLVPSSQISLSALPQDANNRMLIGRDCTAAPGDTDSDGPGGNGDKDNELVSSW